MTFRHMLIARIAAAGTSFSPLPCKAWYGLKVTEAHNADEVLVDADGYASAPPSEAAAAAPPAGARIYLNDYDLPSVNRTLTT
jgi:hypothetical protein